MRFTKMHGSRNDYVVIDGFAESLPGDLNGLARALCDRHTGIGADGLILVVPSETADVGMRVFNADGSEAEMCGNGMRCLARFVCDHAIVTHSILRVETGRGIASARVHRIEDRVSSVEVDMGTPILAARQIPTTLAGDPPLDVDLDAAGRRVTATCLSMGNPHCILFLNRVDDDTVRRMGPAIETHEAFPHRTNVEFATVISEDHLALRVWERGVGETLACGTGACAAVVAGNLTHRTGRAVRVTLPGGALDVDWRPDNHVFLSGPAVEVFSGTWRGDA